MTFNRPPRIQTPLPTDTVKIPAPSSPPSKPSESNWLAIALPLGAVFLTVILMLATTGGSSSGLSYLIFIPIMLASYLATTVTTYARKKKYKRELAEAKTAYRQELRTVESKLQTFQSQQQDISQQVNPDLNICLQRAKGKDPRLGERRVSDADFLCPRLGIGTVATSLRLEPIEEQLDLPSFEKEFDFADKLLDTYSFVKNMPVKARLEKTGSIGIAGNRHDVLNWTRSFVCQIVTHHWPSEVQLAAISAEDSLADWAWVAKLPHAAGALKATTQNGKDRVSALMQALEKELQSREQLLQAQEEKDVEDQETPLPRLIVILDYLGVDYTHPGLSLLLKRGSELGVYGISLEHEADQIPGECGAVIQKKNNQAVYKETGPDGYKVTYQPDKLGHGAADNLADYLAAIDWPHTGDASQPPNLITFLDMFGVEQVEDLDVERWWDGEHRFGYLRAPIGRLSATADLVFDLNDRDGAHGPHGLIGGMTGSGKSEVLKTVLLALAATHSPYDLNFALIDYKGGATFNELARLPHTVGVITNIEEHASYAERVIFALSGEIEHRERILENAREAFQFGRSHIDEYRKLPVKRPLPHLVIVFDEFAEFKQRHKEESKQLISIARKGRSLGVHLILATQNIQSAVDPEILQNSSFRICLKVSETQDSMQMIGIPDAVNLNRGRAYFSANNRRLFQAAYAGGPYQSSKLSQRDVYVRIWPDGKREEIHIPTPDGKSTETIAPPTEANALVDYLVETSRQLRLKKPPSVWPDPLPEELYLPDILDKYITGGWDGQEWHPAKPWKAQRSTAGLVAPIIGLYDVPAKQKQVIYQVSSEQGGAHLLLFGSASSGKSVLIRTLVTSLCLTNSPEKVHFHMLDFGGQSTLKILEDMPHVGTVATRLEKERIERVIQYLSQEVANRNKSLQQEQADNWIDYNTKVEGARRLPAIYLIIDNFRGLKKHDPERELSKSITTLVSGGAASGLFLVISTTIPDDLPLDLFANINARVTFHQADQTVYYRIVGRPTESRLEEEVSRGLLPGRGMLRGNPPLEFHAALPATGDTDKEQTENLAALSETMNKAWQGPCPGNIQSLPLLIPLPEGIPVPTVSQELPFWTMLGRDYTNLDPVGFSVISDGPNFIVAGVSPQSGKTTFLHSWILGLAKRYSPKQIRFVFIDFHSYTLNAFRNLPHTLDYVGIKSELEPAVAKIKEIVKERQEEREEIYLESPDDFDPRGIVERWTPILVFVDDYDRFAAKTDNERRQLADCVDTGSELGINTIISGNISEFPRDFDDALMKRSRRHGCGVLLCGTEGIDQFNNVRRPRGQPTTGLPAGRGYMVNRGRVNLFHAVSYWNQGEKPDEALDRWVEKVE